LMNAFNFKNKQGFTLLEIMVSLSIIGIVFVTLFHMQSRNISLADSGKFHTVSPYLAQKVIAQIEYDLDDSSTLSGDFGEEFPGYKWSGTVENYDYNGSDFFNKDSARRLKQISVVISKNSRQFTLSTWRYAWDAGSDKK